MDGFARHSGAALTADVFGVTASPEECGVAAPAAKQCGEMAPPLLQLKDIALTFGGTPLLTGAELSVRTGERVALVGRNGSGKSTLLKIAAGLVQPDRGSVFVQPGAVVQYLPQEPDFAGHASTLAYVEAGLGSGDGGYVARSLLEQLGLTGEEDPAHLSGGEARRVSLARVLAPSPDILLLDEPTNHLDLTTIEWLERDLDARRTALVIISHDRRFLSNLSRSTVWLDRGCTRHIEKGFAHFEEWRDALLAEEEREQHKLDRKIVAEEHWMRYGVTGRRKRNMRRVGELQALPRAAPHLSRRRRQRHDHRKRCGAFRRAGHRGGRYRQELRRASDRQRLLDPNSARRPHRHRRTQRQRQDNADQSADRRVAAGCGKVRTGSNLAVATLDQHRDSLDPDVTVAEALTGGRGDTVMVGGRPMHVVSYMKDFLFAGEQARTPLGKLSGGERGRLMLAQVLAEPSNLLVLDEPTNDLDMETLDVLEDMLGEYAGTVLLISHDRDFLDRLVSGVIVPEGNGLWTEYAGGYSDMLSQRGADLTRELRGQGPQKADPETSAGRGRCAARKRRMSSRTSTRSTTLPKTIAALQAEAARASGKARRSRIICARPSRLRES